MSFLPEILSEGTTVNVIFCGRVNTVFTINQDSSLSLEEFVETVYSFLVNNHAMTYAAKQHSGLAGILASFETVKSLSRKGHHLEMEDNCIFAVGHDYKVEIGFNFFSISMNHNDIDEQYIADFIENSKITITKGKEKEELEDGYFIERIDIANSKTVLTSDRNIILSAHSVGEAIIGVLVLENKDSGLGYGTESGTLKTLLENLREVKYEGNIFEYLSKAVLKEPNPLNVTLWRDPEAIQAIRQAPAKFELLFTGISEEMYHKSPSYESHRPKDVNEIYITPIVSGFKFPKKKLTDYF